MNVTFQSRIERRRWGLKAKKFNSRYSSRKRLEITKTMAEIKSHLEVGYHVAGEAVNEQAITDARKPRHAHRRLLDSDGVTVILPSLT
jgi:hypothetical protein